MDVVVDFFFLILYLKYEKGDLLGDYSSMLNR